ncbi:MAG: ATP-binding protein [Gammaproteobacteria bacterium]|nr:ATP-binding protein [Gammaproteobacteria bacterium]MDH3449885.1 ATP-binding protein [Gammaproteobacteria bacterium]
MPSVDVFLPGVVDVSADATWDRLVLPEQCIQRLHEFVSWVTHRPKVELEWKFKVRGGPIALFSGPSGTGKTLAAEVLANTLDLPLYRVDLGRLISKYIGETEKNLNALFEASTNEPMLLFFDELDCCFGERNEVRDSHHRYANLEVNYLLTRLESYKGPAILTTNLRQGIDPAFIRRCQMVVEFPFPSQVEREQIWRLHLPEGAPIDEDVDTEKLARESELTGGQIRNTTVRAAFLAAGESSAITSKHIISSIQEELAKTVS